ncbi:MAG TPA: hypothetical protein VIK77_05545 [Tissierellaceae bacterium]
MAQLRKILLANTIEEAAKFDVVFEEYAPEEEILKAIKKREKQPNISFFAFYGYTLRQRLLRCLEQ